MTIQEIRDRIAEIRASVGDREAAHVMEDRLHADVLNAIALGDFRDVDAIRAAALALTTDQIEFERWYA